MAELHLVGTAHDDPRGVERLTRALETLRPARITIESNRKLLDEHERRIRELAPRAAAAARSLGFEERSIPFLFERLFRQAPYEWTAVSAYAGRRGIPVDHIDNTLYKSADAEERTIARQLLRTANVAQHERLTPDDIFLRLLLSDPRKEAAARTEIVLRHYKQHLASGNERSCLQDLEHARGDRIGRPDTYMARRIRQLLPRTHGPLVHVGGALHILDDPKGETLYERVRDLRPRRHLHADF